ncbi:MAG: hypothetical protein SV186_01430 [Candidatus Nanohaloarchaea archaeon]|nr:hypothetical protein [Candidatus Nanohaloarchaea archaeon]
MPDDDLKQKVEDASEIDDFTQALEAFRDEFEKLESRVDQLEDKTETKVRVVDTDNGKRIVLENRQQTWFSPNYFRKILERIDQGEDHDEENLLED